MNLILVDPGELRPDGTVVFRGDRRCRHLNQVLGSRPGDTVRLGQVNGPLGTGRLLAISPEEAVLAATWQPDPPALPPVDLILALPRPIMLQRILAQAAAQGVGRIYLINANRVEKSFFQATLLREEAFVEHLRHGLEQAVDTRLPEVTVHPRFRPFVEDVLPGLTPVYAHLLLAHPGAAEWLPAAAPPPLSGRVLLALGPEGGWVDFEVDKFREQKLRPFSMGTRILRLETAVVALLAQLDLLRQWR
ncbi:MAG: 16S rRNA (uracil(1498)-N(3))-methyltransferase [Desulfobacteraceae bacterium]|nr:16S rRNA (uracil(1498)-N(3))-methyltransferase [Desulfobacteraceae bacterium]